MLAGLHRAMCNGCAIACMVAGIYFLQHGQMWAAGAMAVVTLWNFHMGGKK